MLVNRYTEIQLLKSILLNTKTQKIKGKKDYNNTKIRILDFELNQVFTKSNYVTLEKTFLGVFAFKLKIIKYRNNFDNLI